MATGRTESLYVLPVYINILTQVLLDEQQNCAAVEWVLRYRLGGDAPAGECRQLLGGTTFEVSERTGDVSAWRTYTDGARAHQEVEQLEFDDLDPWR